MSRSRLRCLSDSLHQLYLRYVGYNGMSILGYHRFFDNQSLLLTRAPVRDFYGTKLHNASSVLLSAIISNWRSTTIPPIRTSRENRTPFVKPAAEIFPTRIERRHQYLVARN